MSLCFTFQFVVEITPYNEPSHAAKYITKVLNQQISRIPGRHDKLSITAVTDSGSSMLKGTRDSAMINDHVRCIAHVINNACEAGFKENIKPVVVKCKMLAATTHKSSKTCNLIREACRLEGTPYVKIIQPVKTRWNSMAMTMKSIVRLRPALQHIEAEGDDDSDTVRNLKKAMPTNAQFEVLEALIPILDSIQKFSERLSSDKRPSIHLVIMALISFSNLSSPNSSANQFATKFKKYLDDHFPNCGRQEPIWCLAAMLHPKFKGSTLVYRESKTSPVNQAIFNKTKDDLISRVLAVQPPEEEEPVATAPGALEQTLDRAMSESQWASVEDYLQSVEWSDFGSPEAPERPVNDIQKELEVYFHKLQKPAEADGDVLAFWKANETSVPLLAKFARSILCIPASSASSERLFSEAGKVISNQRTNISAIRAEQLIFIHQNYEKALPFIKSWDIGLPKRTRGKGGKDTSEKAKDPEPGTSAAAALFTTDEEDNEADDERDEDWNLSDVDPDMPTPVTSSQEEEETETDDQILTAIPSMLN